MRNIFESIMDSLNVLCILVVLVSAATAYERLNDTQKCFLIQPGRSLALSCEPESRAPFFWFYGKENTRYLPKGHVEMRNAQLLFHGVQLSDAGRYTCRSVRDPSIETVFHLVTPISSVGSSESPAHG